MGKYEFELSAKTRKAVSGIGKLKGAIGGLAGAAAKAGAAMAGIAAAATAASVKMAADFDQSIATAAAKTDDFEGSMKAFNEAAKQAGLESAFSAKEAADGLGLLAQAGLDTEEAVAAVPEVLALASAGALELTEATDISMGVMQGFGLAVDDLTRVSDVLAKTSNSAATDVQLLGSAMSFVAPVAQGAGIALEEVSAATGMLANAGIKGSRAGTSLNAILAQLGKAADTLGVELDASTIRTEGLAGSLDILKGAGLDSENAMALFGQRAGPAMQALLSQGTDSMREFTEELENSGGAAKDVAAKQLDTLSGALTILKGTTETLAISFGELFLPALQDTVGVTQTWLEDVNTSEGKISKFDAILADTSDTIADTAESVGRLSGTLIVLGGLTADVAKTTGSYFDTVGKGYGAAAAAAWLTVTGETERAGHVLGQYGDDVAQNVGSTVDHFGDSTRAAVEMAEASEKAGDAVAESFRRGADELREGDKLGFFGPLLNQSEEQMKALEESFESTGDGADDYSDRIERARRAQERLNDEVRKTEEELEKELEGLLSDSDEHMMKGLEEGIESRRAAEEKREGKRLDSMREQKERERAEREEEAKAREQQNEKLRQEFDRELSARTEFANSFERAAGLGDLKKQLEEVSLSDGAMAKEFESALRDEIKGVEGQIASDSTAALKDIGLSVLDTVAPEVANVLGSTMGGLSKGMDAGAMFGPYGAAIGATVGALGGAAQSLWGLAQETEEFKALSKELSSRLSEAGIELPTMDDAVSSLVEAYAPSIVGFGETFKEFAKAFSPLVELFGEIDMETIQRALFEGMKKMSLSLLTAAQWFTSGSETIFSAIAKIVSTINDIVSKIPGIDNPLGGLLDKIEGLRDGFGETSANLDESIDNILDLDFDKVKDSVEDFDDSVKDATDSMANVPSVFRRELRMSQAGGSTRDLAANIDHMGPGAEALKGATTVSGNTFLLVASDPDELIEKLKRRRWVEDGESGGRVLGSGVNLRPDMFSQGA